MNTGIVKSPISFRKHDSSLKEGDSLAPLLKRLRRTNIFGFVVTLYFFPVTIVIFIFAKDDATKSTATMGFVAHLIVLLVLFLKNNKRNHRMLTFLKDYSNVQAVHALKAPYKNLMKMIKFIFVLDILFFVFGPCLFPIKLVFGVFYRSFKRKVKILKKRIIKGEVVIQSDEEAIAEDPFYDFLVREGLYEDAIKSGKKTDPEFVIDEEKLKESLKTDKEPEIIKKENY